MLDRLPPPLAEAISQLLQIVPEPTQVYLVGGVVRDILRGKPVHDVDLVMSGEVLKTARQLADALGGAFFPLDEARQTARIILRHADATRDVIDIATWRGNSLEDDLLGRDFTVNAIAVDLRHPNRLIDPLGGVQDLRDQRLRACSPTAMQDDPVRVVRAVRLAYDCQLKIEPATLKWIREAAPLLRRVSAERQRDELFRILSFAQPAPAILTLDHLGALSFLLPEMADLKGVVQSSPHVYDVWEHSLQVVRHLSVIVNSLQPVYDPDQGGNLIIGMAALKLGRYRQQIDDHLNQALTPERTARPLLFLAALYHDIAKPITQKEEDGRIRFQDHDRLGAAIAAQRAVALRLSANEIERLKQIVRHHLRPMLLGQGGMSPSRRAVYRFFRDTHQAGVDVCLLSLADYLGTYGPTVPQEGWDRHLDVVRSLLEAWWEKSNPPIKPVPLLNGCQIIELFGLSPGPQIGELLEALREAQAVGEVTSQEQARDWLKKYLHNR